MHFFLLENRIVGNFSYLQEHVRISDNGAFNNYVDQILLNFDPHPPRVNKNGHFHTIYPLQRYPTWNFYWPHPPPLVHVVIECPPKKIRGLGITPGPYVHHVKSLGLIRKSSHSYGRNWGWLPHLRLDHQLRQPIPKLRILNFLKSDCFWQKTITNKQTRCVNFFKLVKKTHENLDL